MRVAILRRWSALGHVSLQQAVSWLGVAEVRNTRWRMLRGGFSGPGMNRNRRTLARAWLAGLGRECPRAAQAWKAVPGGADASH